MPSFNFRGLFKKSKKYSQNSVKKNTDYLINFGLAEFGSALDMLAAAELTTQTHLRRGFLNHAIDEFRHAELFFNHAKKLASNSSDKNSFSVIAELGEKIRYLNFIGEKPIFSELNELDFINFVMISESAAEKYFTLLSKNGIFDEETRNLFKKVAFEEGHHVSYAKKELEKRRNKNVKGILKSYYYIKWYRFKTDFLSNSRKIWNFFGNLLLSLIYYIFIPLNKLFLRKNYIYKIDDPYSMI